MSVFIRLEKFVKKIFKTSVDVFLDALKHSPNAQGYVSGSVTELLLKHHLKNQGFEVKRIREKWEGKKHPKHHGDFYFRLPDQNWYVLESKGVKSNSEKWHKLYNYEKLVKFLVNHADKIDWIDKRLTPNEVHDCITTWISQNLPLFDSDYKQPLYDFEEIQKYVKNPTKRETEKSRLMQLLSAYSREQISQMIDERLAYLATKIGVLETHFVSGTSASNERTQATPRKDEFNLISVDIFLRHQEHKFLFANPNHLDSSGEDANHLKQNYIIGFVFNRNNDYILSLSSEWCEDFNEIYETLNVSDSISEADMQEDIRFVVEEN